MSAIYVLSDLTNTERYKVGSHTGTLDKLKSRYITAIPTLVIDYFAETLHAKYIEDKFKKLYKTKRIKNTNGCLSEWVTMSLEEIIVSLSDISPQDLYDNISQSKNLPMDTQNSGSDKVGRNIKLILETEEGEQIDQIDLVTNLLSKFTRCTPGTQNVSEPCLHQIIYQYATTEMNYKFLEYREDDNNSLIIHQPNELIAVSILNIMKHLGYKLGDHLDEEKGFKYKRYMDLSWRDTINQNKLLNYKISHWNNLPDIHNSNETIEYLSKNFTLEQLRGILELFDIAWHLYDDTKMILINKLLEESISLEEIKTKIDENKQYRFIVKCENMDYVKKLKCGCKIVHYPYEGFEIFLTRVVNSATCRYTHKNYSQYLHHYYTNETASDKKESFFHQCKICDKFCQAYCIPNKFYDNGAIFIGDDHSNETRYLNVKLLKEILTILDLNKKGNRTVLLARIISNLEQISIKKLNMIASIIFINEIIISPANKNKIIKFISSIIRNELFNRH